MIPEYVNDIRSTQCSCGGVLAYFGVPADDKEYVTKQNFSIPFVQCSRKIRPQCKVDRETRRFPTRQWSSTLGPNELAIQKM